MWMYPLRFKNDCYGVRVWYRHSKMGAISMIIHPFSSEEAVDQFIRAHSVRVHQEQDVIHALSGYTTEQGGIVEQIIKELL